MAHRTARLNVFGRQLLVNRVVLEGWSVAKAAEAQGVSRTTAHKWVRRYRAEGAAGLEDRSSRPGRSPRLGQPRSTVYAVLAPSGFSRLRDADRRSGVPVRYVHDHPGSLVHQDHKKLGRIPDGGGHLVHGREHVVRDRRHGPGYDHFEVVVDDHTRLAYVAHVPDESARSASRALLDAAVWFAGHGVRIERVLTDNAWAHTRATYAGAIDAIGARHKRTRPHRPQTNGKAERFIKTLLDEWAYGRLYRSNAERLERLQPWVTRVKRRADPYFARRHHPDGGASYTRQVDSAIIAALVASAVALAWSWVERAAGQRHAMYEAQLRAAVFVAAALWATTDGSDASWREFLAATAQYGAILPRPVVMALADVVASHDEGRPLADPAGQAIQAMRRAFGTDELSQQTLERIGRRDAGPPKSG